MKLVKISGVFAEQGADGADIYYVRLVDDEHYLDIPMSYESANEVNWRLANPDWAGKVSDSLLFVHEAIDAFDLILKEVVLFDLVDGVFRAVGIFDREGERLPLQMLPWEALALAITSAVPISVAGAAEEQLLAGAEG